MTLVVGLSPALQRVFHLEALLPGKVNRAARSRTSTGGKALNVARALTILGEDPLLLQVLGGAAGRDLAEALDHARIRHQTLWIRDGTETRTCTTLIEDDGRVTELVEECPPLAPDLLAEIDQHLEGLLPSAELLCLSGSLPRGVPSGWYADQVAAAHRHGVRSLVDVQGPVLREALGERPFLVKPNLEEALRTLDLSPSGDSASDAEVAVRGLIAAGAEWGLVSMGSAGAVLGRHDGRLFRLSPPTIEVENPIGAGDALAAGILWGLARGDQPPEAARFGIACAAASCLTETPALLDLETARNLTAGVGLAPFPSRPSRPSP
jgi:1-phosphofructokinase family hexose kinase